MRQKGFANIFVVLISIGFVLVGVAIIVFLNQKGIKVNLGKSSASHFPVCPTNLSGILTAPLIEPKYISSLTPLGNINPPGHTSPVDHIYFAANSDEKIPLYAPADLWITNIITLAFDVGRGFEQRNYALQYTICDGLILDFAGYTDIAQPLKDEINNKKAECKDAPKKRGHDGPERQCSYQLNYKVKAGEQIGFTQAESKSDERGLELPLEIWAANYNKPAPTNIDWSFYDGDDRYAHIMCPFDLYAGDLKKQFYAKLGGFEARMSKDEVTGKVIKSQGSFKPRTVEPICGTVNQNVVGTIAGMWFGEGWKNRKDKNFVDNSRQFSFLYWNIDPSYAEIGNAGEITNGQAGQIQFIANHSGTIDREPSEVKADRQVYCYKYETSQDGKNISGKILVQLIDDRHLTLEYQNGACGTTEVFQNPFKYER